MTNSMQKLTEELQKAVARRNSGQPANNLSTEIISKRFEISPDVIAHLQKMRVYRVQAKTVRVGHY